MDIKVNTSNNGIRGKDSDDADFRISAIPKVVILDPGFTTPYVEYDANLVEHEAASYQNLSDVIITETNSDAPLVLTYESLDTNIATVNQEGNVSRVSDGTARILVTNNRDNSKRLVYVEVSEVVNTAAIIFDSWLTGSFAELQTDIVDTSIATGDPAVMLPMYTSGNTRNANCWVTPHADLSCIDRYKPNSCLIGQQYAIQAGHYPDNTDIYVAMDGTVETRTVVSRVHISVPEEAADLDVVKYDSPLPTKFIPALLPPSDITSYLPLYAKKYGVPCFMNEQGRNAHICDLMHWVKPAGWFYGNFYPPTDARRLLFFKSPISGDSGSPEFLFVPSTGDKPYRLMVITIWLVTLWGQWMHRYLQYITDAVVSMGGSAGDLEIADLTAFPTYP